MVSIFSFFTGIGVLDLGFEEEGYDIVFVNENEATFLDAYKCSRNERGKIPKYGYLNDSAEVLLDEKSWLLDKAINNARESNQLIGFIGGPPCPDFSVGGKNRGREGDKGKLTKTYIDIIIKYQPDFFLFENVRGLIRTQKHREFYEEIKKEIIDSGYAVKDELLNSLSFGVPQDRERIILIGFKSSLLKEINHFDFESDLQNIFQKNCKYNSSDIKKMNWPQKQKFTENSKRMFKYDVPIDLTIQYWFNKNEVIKHPNQNDVFKVKKGRTKIQVIEEGDTSRKSFKRLHRWRYSPTAAYGNNEVHLHPYKVRRISVAEAMAIQSLPKWFRLPPNMTLTDKFKTIGNAVPFLMAKAIARGINEIINNYLRGEES